MLIAIAAAILILLRLGGEAPPEDATEPETVVVDCDVAYEETFAEWQEYLQGGREGEQPAGPEPGDPCFLDRLQAVIDVVEAEAPVQTPSEPPAISPPAQPVTVPSPVVTPVPQPPLPTPPAATPGPTPGGPGTPPPGTPGPPPISPRLSALQANSSAQAVVTCSSQTEFGAFPLIATDSVDVIFVLAMVINGGQTADSPAGAYKLADGSGRQFDMLSAQAPGYSAMVSEIQRNGLPGSLEVASVASQIQPGRNAAVPMLFQVPQDAQDLRLVPARQCPSAPPR